MDDKRIGGPNRTDGRIPTPDGQADPARPRHYTIVRGDTLGRIAKRALGNARLWKAIYDLNREKIGPDPNKIRIGVVLELPAEPPKPAAKPPPPEPERKTITTADAYVPPVKAKPVGESPAQGSIPAPVKAPGELPKSPPKLLLKPVPKPVAGVSMDAPQALTTINGPRDNRPEQGPPKVDARPLIKAIQTNQDHETARLIGAATPKERAELARQLREQSMFGALLEVMNASAFNSLRRDLAQAPLGVSEAVPFINDLLDGWTSEGDQEAIIEVVKGLAPDDQLQLLSDLHGKGRLDQLVTDLDGKERASIVELIFRSSTDASLLADTTRSLVGTPSTRTTDDLLDQAATYAKNDTMAGSAVAAALLTEPWVVRLGDRNKTDEHEAIVHAEQRMENAGKLLLERFAAAGGVSVLRSCLEVGGGEQVFRLLRTPPHRDLMLNLARRDADLRGADPAEGQVLAAILKELTEHGPEKTLGELLGALPAETLPYHLASLGVQTSAALLKRIAKQGKKAPWSAIAAALPDQARVIDMARRPELLRAERDALVKGAAHNPVRTFNNQLWQQLGAIEREHGIRVQVEVPADLLRSAATRQQIRAALSRLDTAAGQGRALPPQLILHRQDGRIRLDDPRGMASPSVSAAEIAKRLPLYRARLAKVGLVLENEIPHVELARDENVRRGVVHLEAFLEQYHNIPKAHGVTVIRFAKKTRLQSIDTGLDRKAGKTGEEKSEPITARVLEIGTELLADLGSTDANQRVEAEATLARVIGESPRAPLVYSDAGYRMEAGTGQGSVQSSLNWQPVAGRDFVLNTAYDLTQGVKAGARQGFGSETLGVKGTLGAGGGVAGPYGEIDVAKLLFRDRDTQVIGGAFAFHNGWLANAGALLYGEHVFRKPGSASDHDRIQAWATWQLLGFVPHVGVEYEFRDRKDDDFYFKVGASNLMPGYVGLGWDPSGTGRNPFEIALGFGGVEIGQDKGWKLTIGLPFLGGTPGIYFNQSHQLTRYRFSYNYLHGAAEVKEIGSTDPKGTANIPGPALRYLFQRLMAGAGVDARPEEIRAWIHEHGLGERVAYTQYIAQNAEDPQHRQDAQQALEKLAAQVGADLMISEYMKFHRDKRYYPGKDPIVSDKEVRELFDSRRESFAVCKTGVLLYDDPEKAKAAAERLAEDPSQFDAMRKAQIAGGAAHNPEITIALGQPNLPESLLTSVAELTPGKTSGVIDLGGGKLAVVRLESKAVPTFEQTPDALREVIRNSLQLTRDQEAFAALFSDYLDENDDFVEAAVHTHRAKLLAAIDTKSYDWRAVRDSFAPVAIANEAPFDKTTHAAFGRAVDKNHKAVVAAAARLAAVRQPIAELADKAKDKAEASIAADFTEDLDEWTGKLDQIATGLREIFVQGTKARDQGSLADLEEKRQDLLADLQKTVDELTRGESKLEELWHEVSERRPDLAPGLAKELEAAKSAPEILALLPIDVTKKDDELTIALERAFAPQPLAVTVFGGNAATAPQATGNADRAGSVRLFEREPAGKQITEPIFDVSAARETIAGLAEDMERVTGPIEEVAGALDAAAGVIDSPGVHAAYSALQQTLEQLNRPAGINPPQVGSTAQTAVEVPPVVAALLGDRLSEYLSVCPGQVAALVQAIEDRDVGAAAALVIDLVPDEGLQRLFELVDGQALLDVLAAANPEELAGKLAAMSAMLMDIKELPARLGEIVDRAERLGNGYPAVIGRMVDDVVRITEQADFSKYEGEMGSADMGSRFQKLERMLGQLRDDRPGAGISVEVAGSSSLSLGEVLNTLKIIGEAARLGDDDTSLSGGLLAKLDITDAEASAAVAATLFADEIKSADGSVRISTRTRQYAMMALEVTGLTAARDVLSTVDAQIPRLMSAGEGLADAIDRTNGALDIMGPAFDLHGIPAGDMTSGLEAQVESIAAQFQKIQDLVSRMRDDPSLLTGAGNSVVATLMQSIPRQSDGTVDRARLGDWLQALPGTLEQAVTNNPVITDLVGEIDLRQLGEEIDALLHARLNTAPLEALCGQVAVVVDGLRDAHSVVETAGTAIEKMDEVLKAVEPLRALDNTATELTTRFGMRAGQEHEVELAKRIPLSSSLFLDVGATVGATEFTRNPDPNLLSNVLGVDVPVQLHTLAFAGTAKLRVTVRGVTELHARLSDVRDTAEDLRQQLLATSDDLTALGDEAQAKLQRLLGLTEAELIEMDVGEVLSTLASLGSTLTDVVSTVANRLATLEENLEQIEEVERRLSAAVDNFQVSVENKITIHTADDAAAYIKKLYARLEKHSAAMGGSRGSLEVGALNVVGTAPGREINLWVEGTSNAVDLKWTETDKDVYRDLYALEAYLKGELVRGLRSSHPTAFQLELRKIFGQTDEQSSLGLMLQMKQYFFQKRLCLSLLAGSQDLRQGGGIDTIGATLSADLGPVNVYLGGMVNPETISDPNQVRQAAAKVGLRYTIYHRD